MVEIPEAHCLARQLEARCGGRKIVSVTAGHTPHKFAWYYGDRSAYEELAAGRTIRSACPVGGMVEITAGPVRLLFAEGASLRHLPPGEKEPAKHQLLVRLDDGTALVASVQMYGGIGVFPKGGNDNPYYLGSQAKPSPLTDAFDEPYFERLLAAPGGDKLSAKALLATEQRIPGLGNGVLQDILFRARVHPRTRTGDLSAARRRRLYQALKRTLREMADRGGRDTEMDLDGRPGGYVTLMSRKTVGSPCPACGAKIEKAAYLGGSVYFCPVCQT